MTKDEALKLALEFIEHVNRDGWILADFEPAMYETIAAIKEALGKNRPWVGLTGLELRNIARQFPEHHRIFEDHWDEIVNLLREAGAQLKRKNNAND